MEGGEGDEKLPRSLSRVERQVPHDTDYLGLAARLHRSQPGRRPQDLLAAHGRLSGRGLRYTGEFKPRSDWTGLQHQTLQPGTTWHWH